MSSVKSVRRKRLKQGVRKKIRGTSERPRLSVFRSNKTIYAQVIDDAKGQTLTASSSIELEKTRLSIAASKSVGKKLAEKTIGMGINTIVFDRNGYVYHGNVKALAEGAREGGLKF